MLTSFPHLLAVGLLFMQSSTASPQKGIPDPDKATVAPSPLSKTIQEPSDIEVQGKLLQVRRIFVENFGDDSISEQVQAMVVSALTESKRFIITENKDKANAILKGSSLEKTSQELHSTQEATAAGAAAGAHSRSMSGSWVNGNGSVSGSSHGGFVSRAMAIEDASTSTETINDARIAVRLVDPNGDVIWATTQESKGAKYKGASADVAEKVVKQLLRDLEKLQKKSAVATKDAPGSQ